MAEYIQHKKTGKMAGSIGDGKANVPTAGPRLPLDRTNRNWTAATLRLADTYSLLPSDIVDVGPTRAHNHAIIWNGPVTINGVRLHVRHNPDATGPALYKRAFFGKPLTPKQLDTILKTKSGQGIRDLHASRPVLRNLIPGPEGSHWELVPRYINTSEGPMLAYEGLYLVTTDPDGSRRLLDTETISHWQEPHAGMYAMAAMAIIERITLGMPDRISG